MRDYRDPTMDIDARVNDLLDRMTLEEMILQTEVGIRAIAAQKQSRFKEFLKKIYFRLVVYPRYVRRLDI